MADSKSGVPAVLEGSPRKSRGLSSTNFALGEGIIEVTPFINIEGRQYTLRIPIMRVSDVTPTMITKYFEQLRNRSKTRVTRRDRSGSQQVKAATIRYHVRALLRIYYYRDRIGDGLKAWEPLFEATMLRDDENYESKTDPIPDDEFQTLLSAAVNFVNQNAVGAIQGLREFIAKEKVIQINEALSKVGNDDLSRRRLTKVSAHLLTVLKPVRTGTSK